MTKGDSGGEETRFRSRARACESCRAAPCAVFCRVDSAYLCAVCDARLHAAHSLASRHERVWMCEVCECAPAALTCKADAAALCAACDADIHSANPLARRHHRTPILAISERLFDEEKEEEDASSLLLDPERNQNGGELLYGGEVNDYLDLVEYGSCTENHYHDSYDETDRNQKFSQCQQQQNQTKNDGSDGVVPVQFLEIKNATLNHPNQLNQERMGIEFESSNLSHSVSLSSMDAVVVPDNTMTDISNSHIESCKATAYHSAGPLHILPQFTAMDREARVLRYREKRKNRKFEKTIRYASRKAYAETRPRIKGRFAKRIDVEVEVDQIFSANLLAETGYGVVPSF